MSEVNVIVPAELPWAPLYTITRSGRPEVSQHGIIYVWAEDRKLFANAGHSLLRIGDTRFPLWGRSLLKPFQLMTLVPVLKQAYPKLTDAHFALLMASQQGDVKQQKGLLEIMAIGGLTEADLHCPACKPLREKNSAAESPFNHPCAGKHLAHLLYLKAKGQPLDDYLNPQAEPYVLLRELLGYLMNRDDFDESVDGCGMPNYALSAVEMAQLYHALVLPVSRDLIRQCPDELTEILEAWNFIADTMQRYADLIGGENRLDTQLMQENVASGQSVSLIAKEGADGLLCVAVGPNVRFSDGLSVFIKLASGYEPAKLKTIIFALLGQLGLRAPEPQPPGIVQTHFHFDLTNVVIQAGK